MICCFRHGRLTLIILAIILGFIGLGFYFEWPLVTQNWPLFLVLLCPLGHLLGGHGHTDHKNKKGSSNSDKSCH